MKCFTTKGSQRQFGQWFNGISAEERKHSIALNISGGSDTTEGEWMVGGGVQPTRPQQPVKHTE